jgi:uncharacterized protein YecE (DUF72 family)
MSIRIGTSGWHYSHWSGAFYPGELGEEKWLSYYAGCFDCVEINSSFYRMPTPASVAHWLEQTPDDFVFALKASRYITHMKKLKECAQPLKDFLAVARCFSHRPAVVLFQLPPHWHLNLGRLEGFLDLLPSDLRFAMEFRDPSWHTAEVRDLLQSRRIAFCLFDLGGYTSPSWVTADLVYLRLHGPHEAYAGRYDDEALNAWAARLKAWEREGYEVYTFFDNDQDANAIRDADRLKVLVGK